MKKIKVKVLGDGTNSNPFRVNLPTYDMVGEIDQEKHVCEVLVPDDEVTEKGHLNQKRIRKKYRDWKKFDKKVVEV